MNLRFAIIAATAASMLYAGCNTSATTTMPVAGFQKSSVQITPEVNSAVGAIGGLDAWSRIDGFKAVLVLTTYGSTGEAFVDRFRVDVDLKDSKLTAITETAAGPWTATVTLSGGEITGRGFTANDNVRKLMLTTFQALLHDVGGPLNLVYREQAGQADSVQVSGNKFVRVPVVGGPAFAAAYYFDPVSNILCWKTRGGDEPGQAGTVSIYTYKMLSNGLLFPSVIKAMEIGQYALIGKTHVYEADFSDVNLVE